MSGLALRTRPGVRPRLDHVPGPRGWEFVSRMLHFRRDSLGALESAHAAYGPVVAFGWPIDTVIIHRPDDARRVLVDNRSNYLKGAQTRHLAAVMGEGLVTNDDRTSWLRRRALVNQAMSIGGVRAALPTIDALVDAEIARLSTQESVEISARMRRLTFAIAARVLLGAELSDEEAEQIDEAVLFASHIVHLHMFALVELPYGVPTPSHLRFARHLKTLNAIFARLIARARRDPLALDSGTTSILGLLAHARDPESGALLSDAELRDEVVTLLVAGYETTASTLTWILGLLATHPQHRAQVSAEIDRAGCASDPLTFPKSHPFTHAVIQEGLRLYTAIPMTSHRTIDEDVLGGHRIPANTNVVIPTWILHRDPSLWGDAAVFRPERFSECPMRGKDAYLPFSKGERGCAGQLFALAEIGSVVTRVMKHLLLSRSSPLPRALSEVSLKPEEGLWLSVAPRDP